VDLGGRVVHALVSSSRHASSSFIVRAPGAPSSSFAKEQKRHDATQTLVTSTRMLRLKYVRSPCIRSRTSLASWPIATTSGCLEQRQAVLERETLGAANFLEDGVDHGLASWTAGTSSKAWAVPSWPTITGRRPARRT
jgi:hypothetical protein